MAVLPTRLHRLGHLAKLGCAVLIAMTVLPAAAQDSGSAARDTVLLDASEYRSELEEVVVVGRQPEWRQGAQSEEWRPDKFELAKQASSSRMEWFPEYVKDERDNYQGVRDRTGEKAEFQLFKWTF